MKKSGVYGYSGSGWGWKPKNGENALLTLPQGRFNQKKYRLDWTADFSMLPDDSLKAYLSSGYDDEIFFFAIAP